MGIDKATITMELGDFQALTSERNRLEKELGEARAMAENTRLGPHDVALLSKALGHALPIVRFAIGNLHPTAYRGWPHADLAALANLLPELPGVSDDARETAPDLVAFASSCLDEELRRRSDDEDDEDDDELDDDDRAIIDRAFGDKP